MPEQDSQMITGTCPFLCTSYYLPTSAAVKAGVVLLHGSWGGIVETHHQDLGKFLAAHGYAALAFAWCTDPHHPVAGLPRDVIDVNLERTIEAINWLQAEPVMDGKPVALYGVSRGAEQALILAGMKHPAIPKLGAIATHAATSMIVQGWSHDWDGRPDAVAINAKAWRFQGCYFQPGDPIEIQNYRGPVFLHHGMKDTEHGPSWYAANSAILEAKLSTRGLRYVVETHYPADEGHVLSAAGMENLQGKLLAFFERHLY